MPQSYTTTPQRRPTEEVVEGALPIGPILSYSNRHNVRSCNHYKSVTAPPADDLRGKRDISGLLRIGMEREEDLHCRENRVRVSQTTITDPEKASIGSYELSYTAHVVKCACSGRTVCLESEVAVISSDCSSVVNQFRSQVPAKIP